MQRSSETIGAIAAALAKAQSELTNPEKSLVGVLQSALVREQGRKFRYASLASGLDITRKCLSRHEIATIQATAIDRDSGLLQLTTTLAHASGEWMSSTWPVCPINEIASPQRMGTALTYARRYALFTMVGLAGEDDMDAPDVLTGSSTPAGSKSAPTESKTIMRASLRPIPKIFPQNVPEKKTALLDPERSQALGEKLLAQISTLRSAEESAAWAVEALKDKNSLQASNAKEVEEAFQQRLFAFEQFQPPETESNSGSVVLPRPEMTVANPSDESPAGIDKSVLTLGTPRRYRNRKHLRFVAQQPCLICGRQPSDAHHLRYAQPRALGRKSSDEFTVPLCRAHHGAVHRMGDERSWWQEIGIDPTVVASASTRAWPHRSSLFSSMTTGVMKPNRSMLRASFRSCFGLCSRAL